MSSCSLFEDIGNSTHENNSSVTVLDAPFEKVSEAIPNAALRAGYAVKKAAAASSIEGEYKADGLDITYRKVDSQKTKIFVRVGTVGKRDKETLIIDEIVQELGLKK